MSSSAPSAEKSNSYGNVITTRSRTNAYSSSGQAIDSAGGFSFRLAGMKAVLEYDINLNLIADHHPID
jgi:hypothetical protein